MADLDIDGNVGAPDLLALLVNWGPFPWKKALRHHGLEGEGDVRHLALGISGELGPPRRIGVRALEFVGPPDFL